MIINATGVSTGSQHEQDQGHHSLRVHTNGSPSCQRLLQPCCKQMPLRNVIARLIGRLRGYFRAVRRSRTELTDSISQEPCCRPYLPPNGKRLR
jgi:hypothetical protein